MADPRIINHQNFDLIRCRLCNRVYEEPKLLPCLHSFCSTCLQSYINDNIMPSESQFSCPTCGDNVELPPVGGVNELLTNQILQRYVDQTHRHQTLKVAGREVMELQRQALTEAELQSPVVMTTIQQIADTASHVIANGLAEQGQVQNFDTIKDRVDLQTRAKRLQDQSIGVVHCIDHVNQGQADWADNRAKIRETIKNRSKDIQETIRKVEKDLLSRLDDRERENEVKGEAHKVKANLHKSLKANLTAAEFLRLLKEHGSQSDIALYLPMVAQQEKKLLNNQVLMDTSSFSFDFPRVDLQGTIEMMFGTLSECTEEKVMWDPADFNITDAFSKEETKPSVEMDVEERICALQSELRSEAELSEDNEGKVLKKGRESDENSLPAQLSGQYIGSSNPRRRPMKSMSLDASTASLWFPETATRTWSSNRPGYQTDHLNNNVSELHNEGTSVSAAIESLAPSIDIMVGQRSRMRRGSAPPSMIIDSLTRRRLSALTILEKANINTEGLLSTSDIESGLSQARLEWLRESVKRKSGERKATSGEDSS